MKTNRKYNAKEMKERAALRWKESEIKRLDVKRKKGFKNIAFWIIIGLTCFAVFYFDILPARKLNSTVNPEIYPRFREIEDYCADYIHKEDVKQGILWTCIELLETAEYCAKGDGYHACPAASYYEDLERLGFPLPPLYLTQE